MTSIEIKKNKKIDLDIPEFCCDNNPLGEHLTKYDMLQQLNGFKFTGIIGKPGMGKTSMMVSWLQSKGKNKVFRKVFENLLVVMPTSSRKSMKKNIFEKHTAEKMWDELDLSSITTIYERLLASSAENDKTLLILDDVGASLKNNDIQTLLRKIIYNRRHLKVHIIMLLQSYLSCPKEVRKLFNNIFIFKPSKVEFENLFDELFETKKDLAVEIMKIAYEKPHDYLMINVENQRLFKGFDELIIHEKEEEENNL
jgi:KaiC/GvpD/RAD55 family RecA-like ATPase